MIFSSERMFGAYKTFYIENNSIIFPAEKPRTVFFASSKGTNVSDITLGSYFGMQLNLASMGVWCIQ